MAFNREVIDSTATDYNVDEISANDFASNTIFVPIDRSFTVSFDDNIDVNTISVFTNNTDIETSERGKRGSIQLSSVGNDGLGSDADSLNLRLKKQTSSPDFVISSDGLINLTYRSSHLLIRLEPIQELELRKEDKLRQLQDL